VAVIGDRKLRFNHIWICSNYVSFVHKILSCSSEHASRLYDNINKSQWFFYEVFS